MTSTTRRAFLRRSAGAGAALLSSQLAWPLADAHAATGGPGSTTLTRPPAALAPPATASLVAWCDTLVPGARAADVGGFVNAQLVKAPDDALLMLRYLDWPPPYDAFYNAGVAALDAASTRHLSTPFARLTARGRADLLGSLLGGAQWSGPPFFLFYLATRADAVDVVYGTPAGLSRLRTAGKPFVRPVKQW